MKKVGITGQSGFVGKHLYNTLGLSPDKYECIEFTKELLESDDLLDRFVSKCDVIVHLAGMNRHGDPQLIYDTNVGLASKLVQSLLRTESLAHVIFSSSSQETKDNLYGKSKKDARLILQNWSAKTGAKFTGMVIPNVFGPFGNPYYNSVVATFCYQLTHNENPKIDVDGELRLIYVAELVRSIIAVIDEQNDDPEYIIPHTSVAKVSEILKILEGYRDQYFLRGIIPSFENVFHLNLFNTFRSYFDLPERFPVKYRQHTDIRGSFTELIQLKSGGQVSFSTTLPGITRGNHFHTRKIERFSVIKGEALIQLRRIGSEDVYDFYLSGTNPAYVDMPIWYTHNITNIGDEELYTVFWINESYNPDDPDTFLLNVQSIDNL